MLNLEEFVSRGEERRDDWGYWNVYLLDNFCTSIKGGFQSWTLSFGKLNIKSVTSVTSMQRSTSRLQQWGLSSIVLIITRTPKTMMKSRLEFELDYMTEIANLLIDEGILKKHKGISILTIHLVHLPIHIKHLRLFIYYGFLTNVFTF